MTYNEYSFARKKNYELKDEQILLRVQNRLGNRFELIFPLADLSSICDRFWLRDGTRNVLVLLLVSIISVCLMWPVFYGTVAEMRILWGSLIAVVLVLAPLAVFWPRTEYVQFKWKTGAAAFAIGRRGAEKSQFDQFVIGVAEAIRNRSNN